MCFLVTSDATSLETASETSTKTSRSSIFERLGPRSNSVSSESTRMSIFERITKENRKRKKDEADKFILEMARMGVKPENFEFLDVDQLEKRGGHS